jgi:hypothetical protein
MITTGCTNDTGATVTVTATAGHAVEINGTTWVKVNHTTGTRDMGFILIGTSAGDCNGAGAPYWAPFSVSAGAPTDLVDVTVPVHAVFTAGITGSITYYLNGFMSVGQDPHDRFWYANLAAHVY